MSRYASNDGSIQERHAVVGTGRGGRSDVVNGEEGQAGGALERLIWSTACEVRRRGRRVGRGGEQ